MTTSAKTRNKRANHSGNPPATEMTGAHIGLSSNPACNARMTRSGVIAIAQFARKKRAAQAANTGQITNRQDGCELGAVRLHTYPQGFQHGCFS